MQKTPRNLQSQVILNRTKETESGRPKLLMMRLASILLSWLYVLWTYGRATEVGLSFGLEVLTVGLRAYRICLILYPFSQNVIFRNPSRNGGLP